jgi:hypothetical protein
MSVLAGDSRPNKPVFSPTPHLCKEALSRRSLILLGTLGTSFNYLHDPEELWSIEIIAVIAFPDDSNA